MKVSWRALSPLAPPLSWTGVVEVELRRMVSSTSPFTFLLPQHRKRKWVKRPLSDWKDLPHFPHRCISSEMLNIDAGFYIIKAFLSLHITVFSF